VRADSDANYLNRLILEFSFEYHLDQRESIHDAQPYLPPWISG
jgi:hypothetical protein